MMFPCEDNPDELGKLLTCFSRICLLFLSFKKKKNGADLNEE